MKKKRNPQDATLRNIRALNKRVTILESQMRMILLAAQAHAEEKTVHEVVIQPKRGRGRK